MTTPPTHYFPALKARAGELRALREIPPAVRATLTPILELPVTDDTDDDAVITELGKLPKKLIDHWGAGYPLIVDATAAAGVTPGGREVVEDLHDALRGQVDAVPVVGLGALAGFVAAVATIAATDGNGACIRLTTDDMEDITRIAAELTGLLGMLRLHPRDIDLVLDIGPLESHTVALYSALVTSAISSLPTPDDWRSLVVLSGAFPLNLAEVTANVLTRIPRLDAQLWQRLAARPAGRQPNYGDYGVSHPRMAASGPWRGAPNLRYTGDEDWFVLKGRLNTPEGNRSFFAICRELQTMTGSPMDTSAFSWGDAQVHRCAASTGGPGGGTEWRAWATSHHLAKVAHRLASHHAP